jgi:hypothetical protein
MAPVLVDELDDLATKQANGEIVNEPGDLAMRSICATCVAMLRPIAIRAWRFGRRTCGGSVPFHR